MSNNNSSNRGSSGSLQNLILKARSVEVKKPPTCHLPPKGLRRPNNTMAYRCTTTSERSESLNENFYLFSRLQFLPLPASNNEPASGGSFAPVDIERRPPLRATLALAFFARLAEAVSLLAALCAEGFPFSFRFPTTGTSASSTLVLRGRRVDTHVCVCRVLRDSLEKRVRFQSCTRFNFGKPSLVPSFVMVLP